MSRSRSWCFTLNNYSEEDVNRIKALCPVEYFDSSSLSESLVVHPDEVGVLPDLGLPESVGRFFKYICFGKEVGESGTPHLQGFAYTYHPCGLNGLRSRIGPAHFEITKGSTEQAIAYCEKDGDFHEFGTRPVSSQAKGLAEAERWKKARLSAVAGDIGAIDDDIFIRYYRTLKEIAKDHMGDVPDAEECTGVWIYGRAGIGKSRKAREDYPAAYLKMCNKWWDGYQKEEFVIIDDVDTKHDCLGHHFKIWGDRYSFLAETKGGALKIRPKKVIITSQYRIDQIWTDQETVDALKRRFKIIHMDGLDCVLSS